MSTNKAYYSSTFFGYSICTARVNCFCRFCSAADDTIRTKGLHLTPIYRIHVLLSTIQHFDKNDSLQKPFTRAVHINHTRVKSDFVQSTLDPNSTCKTILKPLMYFWTYQNPIYLSLGAYIGFWYDQKYIRDFQYSFIGRVWIERALYEIRVLHGYG